MCGKCLLCNNEELNYKYPKDSSNKESIRYLLAECECGIDGWLFDNYLYPWDRRNYLCSMYSGVRYLDVTKYKKDNIIKIETIRKKTKECKIISVFEEENKMIIHDGENYLFLADLDDIKDAYDALYDANKEFYNEWKNKKIKILL